VRKAFVWLAIVSLWFSFAAATLAQQAVPAYRYGTQPAVLIPNIDNLWLNEAGLVHYWNFGDSPCGGTSGCTPGPCATQLADLVSQDTVAVVTPSPVPLNCSSPTASPYPYLGATGMVQDGTTAVELTNQVLGLQGQWFTPASAGILSTLCNNNAGGSCNQPFTISCVVDGGNLANPAYFFSADGTSSGLALGASQANGLIFNDRGTAIQGFAMFSSGLPYFVVYTFDGTSTSSVYLNGVLALATTSPIPQVSPNSQTYFGSLTGSSGGWNGRDEKCALLDVADTPSDIRWLYNSTGLW